MVKLLLILFQYKGIDRRQASPGCDEHLNPLDVPLHPNLLSRVNWEDIFKHLALACCQDLCIAIGLLDQVYHSSSLICEYLLAHALLAFLQVC